MMKNHDEFYSAIGKRQLLIAEDEMINREILGEMLKNDYELIFAEDGAEAMAKIRQYRDTLSLVLLDILMPVMSGLEVLKAVKEDEDLSRLPVIVTTAEKETEIESLNLGAVDFIPKPYPPVGVIQARVKRIIELSEDREIIQSTERDELTGLYNKDYFYRYAEQYDQHHRETETDAIVVDVNHFHMINERYGRAYGDEVLRRIGSRFVELVNEAGGIVGRRESDTFMVYCPHREDYSSLLENASIRLAGEDSAENRVRLRMGVYANADKTIDTERRFDRAKLAADTVRGSFTNQIGLYDDSLHQRQLFAEQLIEDFPAAIAEKQFKVFYQPKFNVKPDTPVLTSAEALVRWIHPTLGMISPGVFIPLFEENGLIQKLDTYVWEETARQIREWKDTMDYAIPVSVNVSRIDMYDPKLMDTLGRILSEHGLSGRDMLLEVTESAYTQDSAQIVETVKKLREMGFRIEMDDFGTGYSSLNMISTLPIDALKLDMHFIRDAFREGGNTHMLEVIIELANYLAVPVIAEGVETEEQLHALKSLGCDIVQGYFFSKPVPSRDFEPFILQKKEAEFSEEERRKEEAQTAEQQRPPKEEDERLRMIRKGIGTEEADEQPEPAPEVPETPVHNGIQLRTASIFFVFLALIAAAALLFSDLSVTRGYQRMKEASDRYISSQLAAADMESGSDYLTDRVRCFVVTGDAEYLRDFFEEIEVNRRRDKAVENLEILLAGGEDSGALQSLNTALALSNELVVTEKLAMRLTVEAGQYSAEEIPEAISSIGLDEADKRLSPADMQAKAQTLVFDNNYMHAKDKIRENVSLCTQSLIRSSSQELENASAKLSLLVQMQTVMTIIFLLIVLGIVVIITQMIRKPLSRMVEQMQNQQTIPPTGVEELRFVTRIYNRILEENRQARERLSHEASHDALTGLFNRGAYDLLIESADTEHMALILIDVDYFKQVNDTYGHAMGDRVLKRVADILRHSFRSVDILCRIGGDEFAVVMTRVNSSMGPLVLSKIARANELLQHPKDDLPPVSLSVGVAFSDRENPQGDIFKDADTALYRVKEAGKKGCQIY
ncbi:MAG: EAL domain-containing protein [Ruminococcaceae bacterium]|jgi:diguanylate cyclase (GGDEF)-like protein|nr:EAL domain-containing protein [Oscillospiraceae bacterium]